jgi:hypothetical protein
VDWDSEDYTPLADANDYPDDTLEGLDTNGITVELASLYVKEANAPQDTGILLEFTVAGPVECNICPSLNQIRGGIVLEDPDTEVSEVNMVCFEGGVVEECMMPEHPDYANWEFWNKPPCWCYERQCRGDIDGLILGPYWVSLNDLTLFRLAIGKLQHQIQADPSLICSDLDHQVLGPYWVSLNDLTILRLYIGKLEFQIPPCDDTYINFWETP